MNTCYFRLLGLYTCFPTSMFLYVRGLFSIHFHMCLIKIKYFETINVPGMSMLTGLGHTLMPEMGRGRDKESKNHQILMWSRDTLILFIKLQFSRLNIAKEAWDFHVSRYSTSYIAH